MKIASRSTERGIGNGRSDRPSISADGLKIAYRSAASNLVTNDTNSQDDIFVFTTGIGSQIERVNLGGLGIQANGRSDYPEISANGQAVAFMSEASNLRSDDSNGSISDIFLARPSSTPLLISRSHQGGSTNGRSSYPALNSDGSLVVFASIATNMVPNQINDSAQDDIFINIR
ncbi:TolB-like translocation protein [Streptomyces cinereoruber]|uniref:hypothetical protein n=1 Tax=Streptomyces cinereoruber TaxID=67260 RepID=UPI0036321E88